jgi:hypothetical protein
MIQNTLKAVAIDMQKPHAITVFRPPIPECIKMVIMENQSHPTKS